MPRATWNKALLAEAGANYDVAVGGQVNKDAAWYYPDCKPQARHIEGFVAFWKGVEVT